MRLQKLNFVSVTQTLRSKNFSWQQNSNLSCRSHQKIYLDAL